MKRLSKFHTTKPLAFFAAFAVLFSATLAKDAKEGKEAWVDPAVAVLENPDFAVQGEYVGQVDGADWGLQVIAEGDGKFAVVAYPGGLPGAGFTGKKEDREKGRAARDASGKVAVSVADKSGVIADGKITSDGQEFFRKVERKSPTLGKVAPEGARTLFDGASVDAFIDGKLDGKLLCQGATTKEKVRSGTLHVEFRLPFQPKARGQGRGNSGCYLQGRYEVQMLDSFGLEGENNECGGIYTISRPSTNMALPPLSWQTYDIDYTEAKFDAAGKKMDDARITVRHNGVVVQDNVALSHGTTAASLKESPEPGPLQFQDHGNPVRYQNIWWKPAK